MMNAVEEMAGLVKDYRDRCLWFLLIEDDRLGLALHPFDLATNKVLAMAGHLEVRHSFFTKAAWGDPGRQWCDRPRAGRRVDHHPDTRQARGS